MQLQSISGVELRSVLTGFKWIGDQIAQLEEARRSRPVSSLGILKRATDTLQDRMYVNKDAVIGSMLICENGSLLQKASEAH